MVNGINARQVLVLKSKPCNIVEPFQGVSFDLASKSAVCSPAHLVAFAFHIDQGLLSC